MLRLVLWPHMWSILKNVPRELEKNVYSTVLGWNVLNITVRSICYNVSFEGTVSLLIFCLDDPSIDLGGALKSPTIIVLLLASSFMEWNHFFLDFLTYSIVPCFSSSSHFYLVVVSAHNFFLCIWAFKYMTFFPFFFSSWKIHI